MKYRVQNIVNNEYLDDDSIFLLPNGEVGWFIEDGSYPHYRKFGHQEDFKVINTENEMLKKELEKVELQLKIAMTGLKTIKSMEFERYLMANGWRAVNQMRETAKTYIKQVERLDK